MKMYWYYLNVNQGEKYICTQVVQILYYFIILFFSHSVMSDSLWTHGLQHARLPCPSPSLRTCSNSCPLSQWCHPTISPSVVPFSSCLQSFPVSGAFLFFLLSFFFCSGFFFFFSFIFISWRLITLQYCSGFCHTLTWISQGFTCIPHPDPPSHLPLYLFHLALPSAPSPSTCLMHPTWAGDLFHSGAFLMSWLFTPGGQSIGVSPSASVLPMNIQDWFLLGLTGWISLQSKGLKSLLQHHSSKASILQCSAFFFIDPILTWIHGYWKNHSFD